MKDIDCARRGWILTDFPNNREQTLALQSSGISPKHVGKFDKSSKQSIRLILVCLEAADNVLIERAAGKRIDPKTKGIYFVRPPSPFLYPLVLFRYLSYYMEYS